MAQGRDLRCAGLDRRGRSTLGFDRVLVISQQGVKREGMLKFMASNTPEFEAHEDVTQVLQEAVEKANWRPLYSRQVVPLRLFWSAEEVGYTDHTNHRHRRILYGCIENRRPDQPAIGTCARLVWIRRLGKAREPSPDRSSLKVTGHITMHEQTIWPRSDGTFDLLMVEGREQAGVFLNSALDIGSRQPILSSPGAYELGYEVFSQGFPKLEFVVKLTYAAPAHDTQAELIESDSSNQD
jgi:hypothetical protein